MQCFLRFSPQQKEPKFRPVSNQVTTLLKQTLDLGKESGLAIRISGYRQKLIFLTDFLTLYEQNVLRLSWLLLSKTERAR